MANPQQLLRHPDVGSETDGVQRKCAARSALRKYAALFAIRALAREKSMKRALSGFVMAVFVSLPPALANAHVSVVSGPACAGLTQKVRFGVGHGCSGADTYSVRIEIPAGVTSVRPESSAFGKASVEKNDAGDVVAVMWQKSDADALDADTDYYELAIRLKAPKEAFSTLYFPAFQVCRAADGSMSNVDWVAMSEGTGAEPAPAVLVLPPRSAGWNKFSVPVAIADLAPFFSDALIVWKGDAAYSSNSATSELIQSTPGVRALSELSANDEIWVKY
jgi:periplasmic copper chaperone A